MRGLFLALLLALGVAGSAVAADPPRLDIVLTPHATGGADSHLAVKMTMQAPGLKAGDGLVKMPVRLVGIPRPEWPEDALSARDSQGPIGRASCRERV